MVNCAMNQQMPPDEAATPNVITVLIADDHPPFAYGLKELLSKQPDLKPVGIANDGCEAVEMAQALKPDVVTLDIRMPKMNGIEATKCIKAKLPNATILILSAFVSYAYVQSAVEAGAAGYLLKSAPLRELMNAIRALRNGEIVFDKEIYQKLVHGFAAHTGSSHPQFRLNAKEVELIKLGAQGLSNKDIGAKLFLSERSVQSHLTDLFNTFGVGSRLELVMKALKEGWLNLDELA
jgi:DNA-binding NarL/FixJ family response regulator